MSQSEAIQERGGVHLFNVFENLVSPVSLLGSDVLSQFQVPDWTAAPDTASFLADTKPTWWTDIAQSTPWWTTVLDSIKTVESLSAAPLLGNNAISQIKVPDWTTALETASFLADAKPTWWTDIAQSTPWWTTVLDSIKTVESLSAAPLLGNNAISQIKVPDWTTALDTASFLADTKPTWWPEFMRVGIDPSGFETLADSLRDLNDSKIFDDVDEHFAQIAGGGASLAKAAEVLELTVPFGHDRAVRAALQIAITATVVAILFGISMVTHPLVSVAAGILAAVGSPKATEVWKATGNAYDRLYGPKNYHPEKALKAETAPFRRSRGRQDKW